MNPSPACTEVKICGITRLDDILQAREAGADFAGVIVEVGVSPRSVPREQAVMLLNDASGGVALTYDAPLELVVFLVERAAMAALQLAGTESPEMVRAVVAVASCPVWKSVHLAPAGQCASDIPATLVEIEGYAKAGVDAVVLDTALATEGTTRRGGTGAVHDWDAAARIVELSPVPIVLAGGLTPANVADAIRLVAPAAVDVSSGVETAPGVKDPGRVRALVEAVRKLND